MDKISKPERRSVGQVQDRSRSKLKSLWKLTPSIQISLLLLKTQESRSAGQSTLL